MTIMHAAPPRRRPRPALTATLALAAILVLPALALAHAVVYPRSAEPGAYERYVLRVPNERDVPTTRVELRFPANVRVVSFGDVPGWTLDVVTDSARRVIAAVWTGTLAPQRFVELPFIAVNPDSDSRIVWPAFQTYANGERVEWTGPEEGKTPASVTEIHAAEGSGARSTALWIAAIALVLALASLGLLLRRAGEG